MFGRKSKEKEQANGDVKERLSEQEMKTRKLEARVKRLELEVGVIGRIRGEQVSGA